MQLHQFVVAGLALVAVGCGGGSGGDPDAGGSDATVGPDGSCGSACDQDGDGVLDEDDQCPDTSAIGIVNDVGCNDAQVDPMLEDTFPPYGLTWTPAGDFGRAGGMTWTYTGIQRGDLFHIYWIVCDDPATLCGLSLDGPIDVAAENLVFSAADSDLPAGKLVLVFTTQITLFDSSVVPLNGRVTLNLADAADAPAPFADVGTLGVTARAATHGAIILGAGFKVTAIGEVDDGTSGWTPYLDYFDSAHKPDPFEPVTVSFGGWFYDE
jgi:hypothetical protein